MSKEISNYKQLYRKHKYQIIEEERYFRYLLETNKNLFTKFIIKNLNLNIKAKNTKIILEKKITGKEQFQIDIILNRNKYKLIKPYTGDHSIIKVALTSKTKIKNKNKYELILNFNL